MSDHTATAAHSPATTHDAHGHDAHGHDEHHGSVLQHAKPYLVIGFLLFAFTGITVALSYIKFENIDMVKWAFGMIGVHGFTINVIIGLVVATFKVCLVGAWFMHLKQEKSTIWMPLLFTFFFVSGLFLLFALAYADPIPGSIHWIH